MSKQDELARELAKGMTLQIEQTIRVCIKPKPRFISQGIWLRIASMFIYVEQACPSFSIKEERLK